MKKLLIIVTLLILFSFKADSPTEQEFNFKFTQTELQLIYTAVDKSNLPHNQVVEILQKIQSQYTSQLPKPDSTKTPKK